MMTIGLAGNPNSGKTTLFNLLTGLRQQTGNYPGITTKINKGQLTLEMHRAVQLLDLPGAYSLYPNTSDEFELVRLILSTESQLQVDLIVYVVDVTELDKQLLLLSQLLDLALPCVILLSKTDKVKVEESELIRSRLNQFFEIPVFIHNQNEKELKLWLSSQLTTPADVPQPSYQISEREMRLLTEMTYKHPAHPLYHRLLYLHHAASQGIPKLADDLPLLKKEDLIQMQIRETMQRYESLQVLEHEVQQILQKPIQSRSDKLDRVVTHPIFGPILFLASLIFIFQAIYAWAELPMNWIDMLFTKVGSFVRTAIGESMLSDFLVDGLLSGLGGILVFVPQIAILFLLLGIMEQSGYMARAVYMFDHIMRKFGLSGKSMVALMAAGACAIPAVMSTRSIENKKERLITILVSPFVSCSARIPVYTILIGLAVPSTQIFGLFNLKGLVFTSLYLMSVMAALLAGLLLKMIFKRQKTSAMLIELPHYKIPNYKDVLMNMWSKTRAFAVEAGKIILIISMILWFMGSFGPGDALKQAENEAVQFARELQLSDVETASLISANQLEASYAGRIGKFMEPAIEPLGYDWKIGIALLASFAAREVFVGTMATIYSMEHQDDLMLQQRLASEINSSTGEPRYNLATAMSLIVFFLFAMQCMSTLAIVKRETNSWKWPIYQFIGMSILAYFAAFAVYQTLS